MKDPLDYRRFMSDWKHEKQDTEILMAIEDGEIEGLMLVCRKSKVHLRGSRDAIVSLLNHLDLEEFDLIAPVECKDLILERYEPRICEEMYMMCVNRGEERISKVHEPVKLTPEDADQMSRLMRESDHVWAHMTTEKVVETMNWSFWLGIRRNRKIVSIGKITFNEYGSVVGVVTTDEQHRSRGYATSVVSALVEEVLQRYNKVLVFVPTNNQPAIHIYEKIGFRPYMTYLFVRK